jgi:multiple sugar transport system substrate-binding protein
MTLPRKRIALLVSLVVLLGACTGAGEDRDRSDSGSQVSGDIRFMVFGDPDELVAYRSLIDAFEKAEPEVSVEMVETSDRDDLIARLSTSFAGGSPPDLFLMNYRFYAQFAARGVLDPLQPRLDASAVFQEEDFYPSALEAFQIDDEQICMPQNISSLVAYYNKDLFQEAGVPFPEAGWTWDDMVRAAKELTVDKDGDGTPEQYGLGMEASIIRLAPFVWSNGGEVVNDEVNPTSFTLDSPEALEALEEFLQLRTVHGVIPGAEEVAAEDDVTRFLNGTTAVLFSSRRDTPTLRTIKDFEWDIAPVPQFAEPAGILHSDAYCLTKESEAKDAAWRFVEFALGPEGAPIVARSGRTVPSLISVANSEAFLDPDQPPASSGVFLDTIPVIRRVPNISTWPEIEDAVNVILEVAMYKGGSARDVARKIMETTEPLFARAQ